MLLKTEVNSQHLYYTAEDTFTILFLMAYQLLSKL